MQTNRYKALALETVQNNKITVSVKEIDEEFVILEAEFIAGGGRVWVKSEEVDWWWE